MASRTAKQPRSRGQIQPKGEGSWLVRVYIGRVNGKRKYASKVVHGTFKQADQELTKMLREQDTGVFVEPSKVTLKDYLSDWLKSKQGLSAKTRRDYEWLLDKYIIPQLGLYKLTQLTPLVISRHYGSLTSDHELSPRTVRYTHAVFSQALTQAVEWQMIVKNPCSSVELPRSEKKSGGDTLSFEETALVLSSSCHDRLHALWRLLLTAGLRPQEALALKWSDLNDGTLSISRALKETGPGKWEPIEETKTGKGRTVTMSAEMVTALTTHRSRMAAEILKSGTKYTRNDFIFATRTGHHFTIPNIRRWWKDALKAAGVRQVRLYDARHTNISQELALGATPNEVADRHGHDVVTMMNTYAHKIPGMQQQAPSLVEKALAAVKEA